MGTSKVISSEYYEVTKCEEFKLEVTSGLEGGGLFVNRKVNWSVDSSYFWTPEPIETIKLNEFIASLNQIILDSSVLDFNGMEFFNDPIFFYSKRKDELGKLKKDTKYMVFGRRYLVIAHITDAGNWKLDYIDSSFSALGRLVRPYAIFDIYNDGQPEIIYLSDSESYKDIMIQLQDSNTSDDWVKKAISVGGAYN